MVLFGDHHLGLKVCVTSIVGVRFSVTPVWSFFHCWVLGWWAWSVAFLRVELLLLFPCFMVKNAYRYAGSALESIVRCGKDVFYRFLTNEAKIYLGLRVKEPCTVYKK